MDAKDRIKYLLLFCVLIVCLWVGWSDFQFQNPAITQEEIRSSIREYIRASIQMLVQYVIPILIIGYFIKKILHKGDEK